MSNYKVIVLNRLVYEVPTKVLKKLVELRNKKAIADKNISQDKTSKKDVYNPSVELGEYKDFIKSNYEPISKAFQNFDDLEYAGYCGKHKTCKDFEDLPF